LLVACSLFSYLQREERTDAAARLMVVGVTGSALLAVAAYRSLDVSYLLIVPVILSSVLLARGAVFVVAAVCLVALGGDLVRLGSPLSTTRLLLPLAILAFVALMSHLSARNLYTALSWTWGEWQRACRNEREARERGGELRRALKALDESTARLERANELLRVARDQAEEARRLKQQFAQTISHELRTPLNLIVGFTDLMVQSPEHYEGPLPAGYRRDLMIVHRNARHLQDLVNDVLDLARIEAAQVSLVLEETDPGALCHEVGDMIRSLVEARGLALTTHIPSDLPSLRLDPTRIRQVLVNLLTNAVRFTEQGGVELSVQEMGSEVVFRVADTGIGIAAEDTARIFEEFHQLDATTKRRHEGAGLGLAISRRFVELHRGRIWVESELHKGSTFSFALPRARPDLLDAHEDWPSFHPGSPQQPQGQERVLLVVTQSLSAMSMLTRYIHGYRAVNAQTLEDARRLAGQLMPQAVIIDTARMLTDQSDLQAVSREWGLSSTCFLACPLPGEEPLRRQLHADGYLIKPVSRQSLWDALRGFGEDVDRVLVVDDDRDFVRLMRRLLSDPVRRYQVLAAHNGMTGLRIMEHQCPDLVLLDLMLPDLHGAQVIERIRANRDWEHIPILVVSAQDETEVQDPLQEPIAIAKAGGLMPGDVVRCVESVLSGLAHAPASDRASGKEVRLAPAPTTESAGV
jgi:signal transduction histidine kinase/CheY-like chemotaxis protein